MLKYDAGKLSMFQPKRNKLKITDITLSIASLLNLPNPNLGNTEAGGSFPSAHWEQICYPIGAYSCKFCVYFACCYDSECSQR